MSGARVALRFHRGPEAVALTPKELIAAISAALGPSDLPIAFAEGGERRPRFGIAGVLPPGYTSDAEWLELFLSMSTPLDHVVARLNEALPQGLLVLDGHRLPKKAPSLQSRLRWAEYSIDFGGSCSKQSLDAAIQAFLSRGSFPWQEVIEGKSKSFDLLALTDDLWTFEEDGRPLLGMRLDASGNGNGRPDSVLKGLGLPEPQAKRRTRMVFSHMPQPVLLWRRGGRFESARPER
jgi:radical SAM-linked protein